MEGKRKSEDVQESISKRKKEEERTLMPIHEMLLKMKARQLQNLDGSGIHTFVALQDQLASQVFESLVGQGFYSCPVVKADGIFYQGTIDLIDFVSYFIGNLLEQRDLRGSYEDSWKLIQNHSSFLGLKVKDFLGFIQNINHFYSIGKDYSLYSVLEMLTLEGYLHRVAVINEEKKVVNFISQSKLVGLILQHLDKVDNFLKEKKIQDFPSYFHNVEKVTDTQEAIEAFKLIIEKKITGVAVVTDRGRLVGNISVKDLKGIDIDGKWWSNLFLTSQDYLIQMEKLFPLTKRPEKPIYALPTDTFEQVMKKFGDYKVHRIYIVNNEQELKPVGVIGLKEILKEFIPK